MYSYCNLRSPNPGPVMAVESRQSDVEYRSLAWYIVQIKAKELRCFTAPGANQKVRDLTREP